MFEELLFLIEARKTPHSVDNSETKQRHNEAVEFLTQVIHEAELPSRTATVLRDQLGTETAFKKLSDGQWLKIGKRVKKTRGTSSTFTGALAELLRYLIRNPRGLPVTLSFAEKSMLRTGKVKGRDLSAAKFLGILEKDGFVEAVKTTAKEALKANHTVDDEKFAKTNPRKQVTLWFPDENLTDLLKFLKSQKVNIRAEEIDRDQTPYEVTKLQEIFGWQRAE